MRIIKNIEQKSAKWFALKLGKVSGTGLKRLIGTPKSQETYYYEILAERLTVADGSDENETAMARGTRLESEARDLFAKKTKRDVEQVAWIESSFDKNVGYSPDGIIMTGKKCYSDIECKSLSSANHVRAWITGQVPEEYMPQIIHAFMVNDDLEERHVVFYDPRITVKPYHVIKVTREEVATEVEEYKKAVIEFLKKVETELSKRIKI